MKIVNYHQYLKKELGKKEENKRNSEETKNSGQEQNKNSVLKKMN